MNPSSSGVTAMVSSRCLGVVVKRRRPTKACRVWQDKQTDLGRLTAIVIDFEAWSRSRG
jgi:hypothetical protein